MFGLLPFNWSGDRAAEREAQERDAWFDAMAEEIEVELFRNQVLTKDELVNMLQGIGIENGASLHETAIALSRLGEKVVYDERFDTVRFVPPVHNEAFDIAD
jgi:hypothetical protein